MKPRKEWIEQAKKNAALEAVGHIRDGFVVGLGSGSTAAYAIEAIGERIKHERLRVKGVPTSYQAFMLAVKYGIPVTTLEEHTKLDVTIDGADQIDDELNLIKGMGGALLREKVVASASKMNIIIADQTKKVNVLGENHHPVPIEAIPFASSLVMSRVQEIGGKPWVRESAGKLGPVITDNGNVIIDVEFGLIPKPKELELELNAVPGLVENGLFVKIVDVVYVGKRSGIEKLTKE